MVDEIVHKLATLRVSGVRVLADFKNVSLAWKMGMGERGSIGKHDLAPQRNAITADLWRGCKFAGSSAALLAFRSRAPADWHLQFRRLNVGVQVFIILDIV